MSGAVHIKRRFGLVSVGLASEPQRRGESHYRRYGWGVIARHMHLA
jgi:hypothetical protein